MTACKYRTGWGEWQITQYTYRENLMSCIKGQKDMTPKDESPRSEGVQYANGEERRRTTNSPRKNEVAGPKQKNVQLWMCLVMKIKSDATKNSIA